MTAFLKIDNCQSCQRGLPWEYVSAVVLQGKTLAGTGVWRSQLVDQVCPECDLKRTAEREREKLDLERRKALVELLGGDKPYREFTFEKFRISSGNRAAYQRCSSLNPATDNLYLWGACGVGKTHLALAIARRCFEESLSVVILSAGQISRKIRMKDIGQEQAILDDWIKAEFLVIDDFGTGSDTAFGRQIFQEILDGRDFTDRAGLVVTSKYSLSHLAQKLGDDAIPSRLAGLCRLTEITGEDGRLFQRSGTVSLSQEHV